MVRDTNHIFLAIDNANLVKNNEYFNDFYHGHTIIGYTLNPHLIYRPNSKTTIEAGIHLLKYSGIETFSQVSPTFLIDIEFAKNTRLLLGSIKGGLAHKLIEPLYKYERFFEDSDESGIQLLHSNRFAELDIWFNWEEFVFIGDNKKEAFSFGWSGNLILTPSESKHKVYIPAQGITYHKGGQGVSSPERQVTFMNTNVGLAWEYQSENSFVKSYGVKAYYLNFFDFSPDKLEPYLKGRGLYPVAFVESKHIGFMVGYWACDSYIAPKGEELFQSVSHESSMIQQYRSVFTAKLDVHRSFSSGVSLGARMESYFDPVNHTFDYVYGVYAVFNHAYFLKDLKK